MESFYEAFINCKHKVLGKSLKPFCLKHCLYLEAIGSPVASLINGEEKQITRKDLELAVVICSAEDDILNELEHIYSPKNWCMRFHRFKRGLTQFLSYLTDFLSFPELWDRSDGKNALNAPWILSKATLLLSKTSLSRDEIWNMPLGELIWYIACFAEQEGLAEIQSEEEQQAIEEAIKNGK